MPISYINGAPPQQTPLTDERGRITAPWFAYLLNLQNASAATAAVGGIPKANALVTGLLTAADWSTFNGKQSALGFTPLNPSSNLSDLANVATARTNLGLGSAATQASTAFDAAGAASSAVAAIPSANASTRGLLTAADWSTFNGKQAALGFTPLNPSSNLSDLANVATARTNLGLGSAATQASSAFDAAGAATAAAAALLAGANTWNGSPQIFNSDMTIWGQVTLGYAMQWNGAQIFGTAKFSNDMLFPFSNGFWYASPNAASWYEFRSITSQGAALANDYFGYQYNQRSTSGGADVWRDVLQMAALTGAVTFYTPVNFQVAPTYLASVLATARTNLGLGTAATQAMGAWTAWAPAVTTAASMTASGLTITSAEYQVSGPVTHFKIQFAVTLGGTANNVLNIALPSNVVGGNSSCHASAFPGSGSYVVLPGVCFSGGTTLTLYGPNGGNYALATYTIYVSGFYRSA